VHPEDAATGQLDQVFLWFFLILTAYAELAPNFQGYTASFSYSPPTTSKLLPKSTPRKVIDIFFRKTAPPVMKLSRDAQTLFSAPHRSLLPITLPALLSKALPSLELAFTTMRSGQYPGNLQRRKCSLPSPL